MWLTLGCFSWPHIYQYRSRHQLHFDLEDLFKDICVSKEPWKLRLAHRAKDKYVYSLQWWTPSESHTSGCFSAVISDVSQSCLCLVGAILMQFSSAVFQIGHSGHSSVNAHIASALSDNLSLVFNSGGPCFLESFTKEKKASS